METPAPDPQPPSTLAPRPSTFVEELVGGLAIVAISLGLLLLPILHFIVGPLGPGIGAFLVASRLRPAGRGVVVLSLVAGLGFAAVVTGAVFALIAFTVQGSPMEGTAGGWRETLSKPGTPLLVGSIAGVWGTMLAIGGAMAGAAAGKAADERAGAAGEA